MNVLREFHEVLIELSDLTGCADLFQQAFEHHQKLYSTGFVVDPVKNIRIDGGGFGLFELLLLADLYNTLGEYEKAIEVIRKGSRWLQGRIEQKYWDLCDDDREYDLPEWAPRSGNGNEDATEVTSGRFLLDINARHRLAVARIKLSEVEEGKVCFRSLFLVSQHSRRSQAPCQRHSISESQRLLRIVCRDCRCVLREAVVG
jgi:general transcription factor 3C polypeptide 3 (transcription factor C subunit 4)